MAGAGPAREATPEASWELYTLTVDPLWRRCGVGQALLERATGIRPTQVWVLQDNGRGRSFYLSHGFLADGALRPHPELAAPEMRMVRRTNPGLG